MIFLHAYTHEGPWFIVSSEGLLKSTQNLTLDNDQLSTGAKSQSNFSDQTVLALSCLSVTLTSECSSSAPLTIICTEWRRAEFIFKMLN